MKERFEPITNISQMRDADRKELIELKGDYEGNTHIRNVLDKTRGDDGHFGLLQSIISKHRSKSRIEEPFDIQEYIITQIDADRWRKLELSGAGMMQIKPESKIILVNDNAIEKESEGHDFELFILHCLVHEIGHSAEHSSMEMAHGSAGAYLYEKQGVRHVLTPAYDVNSESENEQTSKDSRSPVVMWKFLDEAINDEFAEEIVREFALANGYASPGRLNAFYKQWNNPGNFYGQTRRLMHALVSRISDDTGVEEVAARNSLKRACIQGFNLLTSDESGQPFLDTITESGFTKELGRIDSIEQLSGLLAKYQLESTIENAENDAKFLAANPDRAKEM